MTTTGMWPWRFVLLFISMMSIPSGDGACTCPDMSLEAKDKLPHGISTVQYCGHELLKMEQNKNCGLVDKETVYCCDPSKPQQDLLEEVQPKDCSNLMSYSSSTFDKNRICGKYIEEDKPKGIAEDNLPYLRDCFPHEEKEKRQGPAEVRASIIFKHRDGDPWADTVVIPDIIAKPVAQEVPVTQDIPVKPMAPEIPVPSDILVKPMAQEIPVAPDILVRPEISATPDIPGTSATPTPDIPVTSATPTADIPVTPTSEKNTSLPFKPDFEASNQEDLVSKVARIESIGDL